jgi:hypothetical protein
MREKYHFLGNYSPITRPEHIPPESKTMVAKYHPEPVLIRLWEFSSTPESAQYASQTENETTLQRTAHP